MEIRPARPTSIRNDATVIGCSHRFIELIGAFDQVSQANRNKDTCCVENIDIGLPSGLLR